jgi:hypothetical protein
MNKTKDYIVEQIKKNRPNLSDSSLKTYVSLLSSLYRKQDTVEEPETVFNDYDKIIKYLHDKPETSRKTSLSALFVLTQLEPYKKLMLQDCAVSNKHNKEQKMNVKQKDNWISTQELQNIYGGYMATINLMVKGKIPINEFTIINFILFALLSGASKVPPRRSLDYSELMIDKYDKKTDNFFDGKIMVFNKYKTKKFFGQQTFELKKQADPRFFKILLWWVKMNKTPYLLYSTNGNKLTPPQITRMLNKITGRAVSTNMLRHIYITDRYGKANEEQKKVAEQMSHSITTQAEYIKR